MRVSKLVAADVAQKLVGEHGVEAVGIIVMISSLGTLAASMLTGPRILWAMASDGFLFPRLARVHPSTKRLASRSSPRWDSESPS